MWSYWTGQKVVCIHPNFSAFTLNEICPVADVVYTIRHLYMAKRGLALRLVEIVNTPKLYDGNPTPSECAFLAYRFRPLTETKSDISLLCQIRDNPGFKIKPTRIKEPA